MVICCSALLLGAWTHADQVNAALLDFLRH
jgi:hypothetical protein